MCENAPYRVRVCVIVAVGSPCRAYD